MSNGIRLLLLLKQGVRTREEKEDAINISPHLQRMWDPTQQPRTVTQQSSYDPVMNMMERMFRILRMTSDVMMMSGDGVLYQ